MIGSRINRAKLIRESVAAAKENFEILAAAGVLPMEETEYKTRKQWLAKHLLIKSINKLIGLTEPRNRKGVTR